MSIITCQFCGDMYSGFEVAHVCSSGPYAEQNTPAEPTIDEQDIVYRLLKRAEIRRQISTRKSVQEGAPDRISDLLEEAATVIKDLRQGVNRGRS